MLVDMLMASSVVHLSAIHWFNSCFCCVIVIVIVAAVAARPVDGVWEVKLADFGLSATVDVKQRTLSTKRTIREADTTAAKVDHE
jgi:hypothetical protein